MILGGRCCNVIDVCVGDNSKFQFGLKANCVRLIRPVLVFGAWVFDK